MSKDYGAKFAARFNKTKKITESYSPGDPVMLHNINKRRKGDALWTGPYSITKASAGIESFSFLGRVYTVTELLDSR